MNEKVTINITHLINPFPAKPGSEHDRAQRVTFASMRRAVTEAQQAGVEVEVLAAVLPGDESAVEPPGRCIAELNRTVADLVDLQPRRPLPLIADLLGIGGDHGRGELLVYTNIDIALQPHFYVRLAERADAPGCKRPLIINRRTIPGHYTGPEQLEQMYRESGAAHPGFDCFVFPRTWVKQMSLGETCIGAMWFDGLIAANLDILSGFQLDIYKDEHLTFHIGDEKNWVSLVEYEQYNLNLARMEFGHIQLRAGKRGFPESSWCAIFARRLAQAISLKYRLIRRIKSYPMLLGPGRAVRRWVYLTRRLNRRALAVLLGER